ncbi:unnamed protein product [Symbiodinium natans]|uniref:PA14 domain-containing protein n=1 Tax=Symbiodinium natans TaxID=878477 RepID=A0A812U557_9DINO|nr:unnamed protein product [Symbiodinium natans]
MASNTTFGQLEMCGAAALNLFVDTDVTAFSLPETFRMELSTQILKDRIADAIAKGAALVFGMMASPGLQCIPGASTVKSTFQDVITKATSAITSLIPDIQFNFELKSVPLAVETMYCTEAYKTPGFDTAPCAAELGCKNSGRTPEEGNEVLPPEQVVKHVEPTGAAETCYDLPMGDRFIDVGDWRLAAIDNDQFSISHKGKADCSWKARKWLPLDMPGQGRTVTGTWQECQRRCSKVSGCSHFSWWSDGGCHIQDSTSTEAITGNHVTSGPPSCWAPDDGLECDYFYHQSHCDVPDLGALTPAHTVLVPDIFMEHGKFPDQRHGDNFCMRCRGRLLTKNGGDYKFFLNSDDGSLLYLDGEKIVDNNGCHPARERSGVKFMKPGSHDLVVDFCEVDGGESVKFEYEGPDSHNSRVKVPKTVLKHEVLEDGVECDYFYQQSHCDVPDLGPLNPSQTITVPEIFMEQGRWPQIRHSDHFCTRCRGKLVTKRAGDYTFFLSSDDGSLLYLNGERIVDNNGCHAIREISGNKYLEPGSHDLVVDFCEVAGFETLRFEYQGPDSTNSKVVVPKTALKHKVQVPHRGGASDCYAERTLVADEGSGVGQLPDKHGSISECQAECSKIGECKSFAYCASSGICHYRTKVLGAHDPSTTDPAKLQDCKSWYKTECKDCYAERTLVADEGSGVGQLPDKHGTISECQAECSKIGECKSFAYCASSGICHYRTKVLGAHDPSTTDPAKLQDCKSWYKTECKDEAKAMVDTFFVVVNGGHVEDRFKTIEEAKTELNKIGSGLRMICEVHHGTAKADPHVVGGQDQGAGHSAGFNKHWQSWDDIHAMNRICQDYVNNQVMAPPQTAMIFRKDGQLLPGPHRDHGCCWGRPAGEAQGIKFGFQFIQIGQFRLGAVDDNHFSISHIGGHTPQLFRHDGTLHPNQQNAWGTFDRPEGAPMGISVGEKFIQMGNFRLGDADGPFLVTHRVTGKTIQVYQEDGTVQPDANSHWAPKVMDRKPSAWTCQDVAEMAYGPCNSDFGSWGDRFIQLGDWRLAATNDRHLSISHKDGQVAQIYRDDGTLHPGPRTDQYGWASPSGRTSSKSASSAWRQWTRTTSASPTRGGKQHKSSRMMEPWTRDHERIGMPGPMNGSLPGHLRESLSVTSSFRLATSGSEMQMVGTCS